jgi:hypothetical protein
MVKISFLTFRKCQDRFGRQFDGNMGSTDEFHMVRSTTMSLFEFQLCGILHRKLKMPSDDLQFRHGQFNLINFVRRRTHNSSPKT